MGNSFLQGLLKSAGNEYASVAADGLKAGDVTGYHDTGSYTFNAILGGSIYRGLPNNGVTAFAGEPSTGKTFFALSVARLFLKDNPGGAVFYFETESAMTSKSLKSRQMDMDGLAVLPVATVQDFRTQAVKVINDYAEKNKDGKLPPILFILDSLGGLSTNKEIEDITSGEEKRDMTRAQLIRGAFRVLTLKLGLVTVPLICTNHVYDVVNAYIPTKKMNGGAGLEYAASTIIFLSKKMERDDKTKKVTGAIITAIVNKGRLTKEKTKVECLLDFATGLDRYYGLLPLAIEFGIVTKSSKGCLFPNGLEASEAKVEADPEKFFTKDVLDAIDVEVQKNFEYGGHTATPISTPVGDVEAEAVKEIKSKKKKEVA